MKLSNEEKIILYCLRSLYLEDSSKPQLNEINFNDILWSRFIRTLEHNQITGFIFHVLKREKLLRYIPFRKRMLLQSLAQDATNRFNRARDLSKEIKSIFEKHNIPFKFLKGASLIDQIYSAIPFRTMEDVDILIHPTNVGRANHALKELNFYWNKGSMRHRWHHKLYKKPGPEEPNPESSRSRRSYVKLYDRIDLHWTIRYLIFDYFAEIESEKIMGPEESALKTNSHYLGPLEEFWIVFLHTFDSEHKSLRQTLDGILLFKTLNRSTENLLKSFPVDFPEKLQKTVLKNFNSAMELFNPVSFDDLSDNAITVFRNMSEIPAVKKPREKSNSLTPSNQALKLLGYFFPDPDFYYGYSSLKQFFFHYAIHGILLAHCLKDLYRRILLL